MRQPLGASADACASLVAWCPDSVNGAPILSRQANTSSVCAKRLRFPNGNTKPTSGVKAASPGDSFHDRPAPARHLCGQQERTDEQMRVHHKKTGPYFGQFSPDDTKPWWQDERLQPPTIEDFQANTRAAQTLLGYSHNGEHPRWIAEDIKAQGAPALLKLADLAKQLDARQPGRGHAYVNDVFAHFTKQEQDKIVLPLPPEQKRPGNDDDIEPLTPMPLQLDRIDRGTALGNMPQGSPGLKGKQTPDGRFQRHTTSNSNTSSTQTVGDGKKKGQYIWRTQGDSKVRDAHAERDGKVFSWDDPPEGGHPGEDYNCRCTAEEIEDKKDKEKCEKLKRDTENARLAIQPLEQNLKQTQDDLTKAEENYVEKENRVLELIATAGLSEIFEGEGSVWDRLKKAAKKGGPAFAIIEIERAINEMSTAERKMDDARLARETAFSELAEALDAYRTAREKLEQQCKS